MHKFKKLFPQDIKNLYHLVQAVLANLVYGFPSRKIKVIGITGTDGKTTTAQMTARILEEAGKRVALASTINFVIAGLEEKNLSHFTTESAFSLQKFIKKAVKANCEYLVLETSSHSLDQHRVWGVAYKTAVITNATREHLDYHRTMENYRLAKRKLFEMVAKNKGTVIVNLDMEQPVEFLSFETVRKFGYSTGKSQLIMAENGLRAVVAEKIELGIAGSNFLLDGLRLSLKIAGEFNVENALAAACVGLSEGIGLETIKEALGKIEGVAGRLESVDNELGVHILVDFALTPNALERLYKTLIQAKKPAAKIIAVFGSCGDRDRGKRPLMGEIVARYAEVIVLTNDEPYHEEPLQIMEEIAAGIKNKTRGENLWIIADRREAIKKALAVAAPGDVVCVTGMGNLETMVVGDRKIPWNDKEVIEEELKKIS